MGSRGYTLLELLVTLSIGTSLIGLTAAGLKEYSRSSKNAVASLHSFIKQVRVKSISRTAAYRVAPSTNGREIRTSFANTCASPSFTSDSSLTLELPDGSILSSTSWSFCITPRGLVEANTVIGIQTEDAGIKSIEVLLGGGTREL